MFYNAASFNGNICDWNVSNVNDGRNEIVSMKNAWLKQQQRRKEVSMLNNEVWPRKVNGHRYVKLIIKDFLIYWELIYKLNYL